MLRKLLLSTILTSLLGLAWRKRHLVIGDGESTNPNKKNNNNRYTNNEEQS